MRMIIKWNVFRRSWSIQMRMIIKWNESSLEDRGVYR